MNEDIMKQAGFGPEMERVQQGLCPFCAKPIVPGEFRDELSVAEYANSGLCQACQDETFGKDSQ